MNISRQYGLSGRKGDKASKKKPLAAGAVKAVKAGHRARDVSRETVTRAGAARVVAAHEAAAIRDRSVGIGQVVRTSEFIEKRPRPKLGPEFDVPLGKPIEPASPVTPPPLEVPPDVLSIAVTGDPAGTVRLVFPCPAELAGQIDAYWHGERLGSRSAAIRALIERGLK